jgi:hypothetical protein
MPQPLINLSFKFTWLLEPSAITVILALASVIVPTLPCLCLGLLSLCRCCHPRSIPLVLVSAVILLFAHIFALSPCLPLFITPVFALVIVTLDVSNRTHRPYHLLPTSPLYPPLPPPIFLFPSFPSRPTW